jgi:hypothetical protein
VNTTPRCSSGVAFSCVIFSSKQRELNFFRHTSVILISLSRDLSKGDLSTVDLLVLFHISSYYIENNIYLLQNRLSE